MGEPSGERILVIDDEDVFRMLLQRILTTEGYAVEAAADGVEAENILQQRKFDLILLDLAIPEISGLDVLKFIRNRDQMVAVVIVSGDSDIRSAIQCIKLGATDYLIKPIEPDHLLTLIKELLEEKAVRYKMEFDEKGFTAQLLHIIAACFNRTSSVLDRLSQDTKDALNTRQQQIITSLNNNLHYSLNMTLNILELLKCVTSQPTHQRVPTDLKILIERVSQRFFPLAQENNITLTWSFQCESTYVTLNPESIEQVVTAILNNAIFSTRENGSVTVSGTRAIAPHEGIMVTVQNNGKGISQEDLSTIIKNNLEPSSNAIPESSLSQLGLALCEKLIELHGGEIWTTPETPDVSAIHFTLPT
jgi:DNA-binding response OmpR family regulator